MSVTEHIYNAEEVLPVARRLEASNYEEYQSLLQEGERLFVIYRNAVQGLPREASWVHQEVIFKMSKSLFQSRQKQNILADWEGFYAVKNSDTAELTFREHYQSDDFLTVITLLEHLTAKG